MAILKVANVHHDASGFTRTQTSTPNTISFVTSNQTRVTFSNTGNVGIGTTNPGYVLDVVGTVNASSFLENGISISSTANSYADIVGAAANAYTRTVGSASNTYADTVGAAANAYTRTVGSASNAYTVSVGSAANSYAITVGAASNTWANTISATRSTASNTYAATVGAAANTNAANGSYISTGLVKISNGGTGANLTDPNADRLMFWDDSTGSVAWLTAGSGLTISGTTITSSGIEYIGSAATTGTFNLDFINIPSYTTILVFFNAYNNSASRNLRVLLSSDNGSTFGSNRTIATINANGSAISGLAIISNTNASGTSKTITPSGAGLEGFSTTLGVYDYTTVATETTITGIINALRFNLSGSGSFSVSLFGVI